MTSLGVFNGTSSMYQHRIDPVLTRIAQVELLTFEAIRNSRMSSFRRSLPSNITFCTARPRRRRWISRTARCSSSSPGGSGTLQSKKVV